MDDVIVMTKAGFKAAKTNEIINLKTAEKCLQFGIQIASQCFFEIERRIS